MITLSEAEMKKMATSGVKKHEGGFKAKNVFTGSDTFKVADKFVIPENWREDVYENTRMQDSDGDNIQFVKVTVTAGATTKNKDLYPGMFIKSREEYTTDQHKVPIPTGKFVDTQGDVADLARTANDTEEILDFLAAVCAGKKTPDGTSVQNGKRYAIVVKSLPKVTTLRFNSDKLQSTSIGHYVFVEV